MTKPCGLLSRVRATRIISVIDAVIVIKASIAF